ncbi:MAG: BTAD domain-containing putative transcriptional regulator [Acidimicrobiales bacterium]
MKSALTFSVLGPLQIRHGDQVVDIPRHKERQLIAALLLDANTTVSTDLLVDRLWNEDAPAKPLTSLRACVSNVRKALVGPDDIQPLVTDRGGYMLQVSPEALDSLRFEELVSNARQARAADRAAEAATMLDEAIQLVRGEPLADMAYDEFAQREVIRLAELIASAQELRAQVAVELGEAAAWLPRIGELIDAHPLREQLQATRMIALYQLGRQADALRCYSEHRRAMIDELGIEPSPELQDLEAKILAQDDSLLAALPPNDSEPVGQGPADVGPAPSHTALSIVGRETELAILSELATKPPGQAFIIGEAGSGKSTVADGFLDQLAATGWRTARALCPDDDGVPPLWPWRQVFRDLDLGEAAAGFGDEGFSRFEFIDDLASSLTGASAHSPIAIFVDDLQWADQDSLKLITHLARRVRTERLLVIGAARTTPAALSGLAATWIELKSLTVEDVASIIERLTGEAGDLELAADLCHRTGGNAYFVTELIEFARRFGEDIRGDLEIPSHVRELVEQRIALLADSTQQVLETAALELQNFSVDILAQALDQTADQVREALQPALDAGVIVPDSTSFERFRFDHAIARETVADRSDPAARVRRHAALGEAIETLAGSDAQLHATQLSRHYGIGAPSGTADKAVRWATAAAAKASETWSHGDAIVHLQRALEADRHLSKPDPKRRCRLLIDLGIYSKIVGDVATTDSALLEAFRLAESLGEPMLSAEVAIAMSEGVGNPDWRWYWTPVSTAVANLRKVLDSLQPGDSPVRVSLMTQLASDGYTELDFDERSSLLVEAAAMAERLDEPKMLANAMRARRTVEGWSWEADEVLAYDRRVLALFEEQGIESQAQQMRGMILADLLTRGEVSEARKELRELNDLARIHGSLTWRYYAQSWQVLFAQMSGQWDLASQLSMDALDPVSGLGEDFTDAVTNQMLITAYYQGNFDQVVPVLRHAAELSDRPLITQSLLNTLAVGGQTTEAEALIESSDGTQPDIDSVGGRIAIALAAETLAVLDRPAALPPLLEFLSPAASSLCLGNPGLGGLVFYGPLRHHLATGLVAVDRFDEASRHLELGRQHMTMLEAKPQLIRLDLVEAMLVARRDGKAAARTLIEEVQTAASLAGMFGVAAQAERLLAE